MPKTTTVSVRVTDGPPFKAFVQAVREIRDRCLTYDEAAGNFGDVERIGDQLDDALADLHGEAS